MPLTEIVGAWLHRRYHVGQMHVEGARVRIELLGPEKKLERPVGRPLTANCIWKFGDPETCKAFTTADAWQPGTAYVVGDVVQPSAGGLLWFIAGGSGMSGLVEPTWPPVIDDEVVDDGFTWTAIGARRVTGTVTAVDDFNEFDATGIDIQNDWFGEGHIRWLTGINVGVTERVRSDNGLGHIVLHHPMLDPIDVGDTFEAVVGCRKRWEEDCLLKFDNVLHNMSFPFLAPENVTATAPHGGDDD